MLHILRQIAKTGIKTDAAPNADLDNIVVSRLQEQVLKTLGRALAIRQVDAGSCNGCELEIHALGNPYYNIEGLGIRFVASPRHADMLLVTGPVSKHMAIALQRTYDATPEPKLVVAVGDCGCSGGIFGESYASFGRVANVIPVDVEIPGCPPTPTALLEGILAAIAVRPPTATPADNPDAAGSSYRTSNSIQRSCCASRRSAARATSQCGAPMSFSVRSPRCSIESNACGSTDGASSWVQKPAMASSTERSAAKTSVTIRTVNGCEIGGGDAASFAFMANSRMSYYAGKGRRH